MTPLTPREIEIVRLIWEEGLTNRDCAKRLKINARTVESHINAIHKKTGTRNVATMLRWWVRHGDNQRRTV